MAAMSRKKGRRGICSAIMHRENFEPKAALVELGVRCERARRKGSNGDWEASGSARPVRREGEKAMIEPPKIACFQRRPSSTRH